MLFSNLSGYRYFLAFLSGMIFLYFVAFAIGIRLKAYLSESRVERFFAKRSGILGNAMAAAFGAVTPFCSCTTIPIFAGMLESEVSLGYAMSFLIASPTVNPPALFLLGTLFGWKLMLYYTAAVFVAAIIGGRFLGHRRLAGYVHEVLVFSDEEEKVGWREMAWGYARFLRGFIIFILLAAVVATLLKGWTPSERLMLRFVDYGRVAVPAMVGLGLALYTDLLLLIPIAHTLMLRGIPEGTVFAFTMAASGVGLPSLILLSKVVHRNLILIYLLVLIGLLTIFGYTLNLVLR